MSIITLNRNDDSEASIFLESSCGEYSFENIIVKSAALLKT